MKVEKSNDREKVTFHARLYLTGCEKEESRAGFRGGGGGAASPVGWGFRLALGVGGGANPVPHYGLYKAGKSEQIKYVTAWLLNSLLLRFQMSSRNGNTERFHKLLLCAPANLYPAAFKFVASAGTRRLSKDL